MIRIRVVMLALLLLFAVVPSSMAMDALASFGSGVLLQSGYAGEICYAAGVDVPTITPASANYRVLTIADVLYSDRPFGAGTEIQAIRIMTTGFKTLPFMPISLGLGSGIYTFLDNTGENSINGVIRCGLAYEVAGMQLFGGGDILPMSGPDMYVVGLQLTITAW